MIVYRERPRKYFTLLLACVTVASLTWSWSQMHATKSQSSVVLDASIEAKLKQLHEIADLEERLKQLQNHGALSQSHAAPSPLTAHNYVPAHDPSFRESYQARGTNAPRQQARSQRHAAKQTIILIFYSFRTITVLRLLGSLYLNHMYV
jgi:hypothetical protein